MRTGLMYTASAFDASISDGASIFALELSADTPIILHEFLIMTASLVHDKRRARMEALSTTVITATPMTEVPLHSRNTVSADAEASIDAVPEGSVLETYESFQWDILIGLHWLPAPKDRLYLPADTHFQLRGAGGAIVNATVSVTWEEL